MSCAKPVFLCLVEMAATRSIVADLNQGDKLNDKNYDIWHLVPLGRARHAGDNHATDG